MPHFPSTYYASLASYLFFFACIEVDETCYERGVVRLTSRLKLSWVSRRSKRKRIKERKDRDSIPWPLEWQASTLTARPCHSPSHGISYYAFNNFPISESMSHKLMQDCQSNWTAPHKKKIHFWTSAITQRTHMSKRNHTYNSQNGQKIIVAFDSKYCLKRSSSC